MSLNQNGTTPDLTAYWVYDQSRVTDEIYPNAWISSQPYHSEFRFGRGYDALYRQEHMTWYGFTPGPGHPQMQTLLANTAQYGADQQMKHLTILSKNEWRTYNNLGQLTSITTHAFGQDTVNLSYTYPTTTNDGRAETMTDQSLVNGVAVNETVSYGYDMLKRLTSAATTGPQWGVSYGYDGFGNLHSQTVTKGSGPGQFSLSVNPSTNRITNYGAGGYDANGNVVNDTVNTYGWDAENRLESVNRVKRYSYNADNLRVFDGTFYYFYAPDGKRLGKYSIVNGAWQTDEVYVYFNGRMIATGITAQTITTTGVIFFPVLTDRVGSVRLGRSGPTNYYPYGQERVVTANGKDKFGTYRRDALTGFDYAQQRYYQSGIGRFLSADPYMASGGAGNPSSWNRYAYVQGDPVNKHDPSGLCDVAITGITMGPGSSEEHTSIATVNGMHISYPYAGTGYAYGVASVFEQSLGISDPATAAAYQAIVAAAQDPGPINVVTFSSGAQAFTSAMWALHALITERIQNVTYISPGAGLGPLASGNGTTTARVGSNPLEAGLRLPYQVPSGTTFVHTGCGHDLDCQIRAARQVLENAKGSKCSWTATFSIHIAPPAGWNPGTPAVIGINVYDFNSFLSYYWQYWWFERIRSSSVEQVFSKIIY